MIGETALLKLATDLVSSNKEQLTELSSRLVAAGYRKLKVRLDVVFHKYLDATSARLSRSRSMIFKEDPRYLYDFYTPLDFQTNSSTLVAPDYRELVKSTSRILITGSGGSGKSTFLRHVFLTCLKDKVRIPIFVELRRVSDCGNLIRAVLNVLEIGQIDGDESLIIEMLKTDRFVLILDGLDELNDELQATTLAEIDRCSQQYPNTVWITSSRPMDELLTLKQFTEFKTLPLTLEKSVELVKKLGVDKTLAKAFCEELESSLYAKHRTFLSNPLLLSIMLLTYRDNASIPTSLHLFFEQAFYALFNKHDASKGQWERPFKSGLNATDFESAVAAFSISTYLNKLFTLTESQLTKSIDEARHLTQLPFSSDGLKHDLVMSICLLVKDGNTYSFLHRTFQEYFAAVFLNNLESDNRDQLVSDICLKQRTDLIMSLLWGINKRLIERVVILPLLRELKKSVKYRDSSTRLPLLRFMKILADKIYVDERDVGNNKSEPTIVRSWSLGGSQANREQFIRIVSFCKSKYRPEELGLPVQNISVERELVELKFVDKDMQLDEPGASFGVYTKRLQVNNSAFTVLSKSSFVGRPLLDLLMTLLSKLEEDHAEIQSASNLLLKLRGVNSIP